LISNDPQFPHLLIFIIRVSFWNYDSSGGRELLFGRVKRNLLQHAFVDEELNVPRTAIENEAVNIGYTFRITPLKHALEKVSGGQLFDRANDEALRVPFTLYLTSFLV
jgi:hypothetical protein